MMTQRKHYLAWICVVLVVAACGTPAAPGASSSPAGTPPASATANAGAGAGTRPADEEQPGTIMLDGTSWTLAELNGNPTLEGSTVTLSFANGNQASGNGGCNSYGGSYTATNGAISFGDIVGTLRACAEAATNEQESAYFQALREAALYRVVDGRLEIQNAADATTLVFDRVAGTDPTPTTTGGEQSGSTALDGTTWQLVLLSDRQPAESTTITLAFTGGNTFNGSGGCNGYGGTYTAAADGTWTLGMWENTVMACGNADGNIDQNLTDQESKFFDTFRRVARYQQSDGQLQLQDANDTTLLLFAQPPAAVDPALMGGWELATLHGAPLVANTNITANFSDDGIGGFAGCNSYGGSWRNGGTWVMSGGKLVLPAFARTLVGCPDPVGTQEDAYLNALAAAATYTITGEQLEIQNAANETTLVFRREEQIANDPQDLIGTRWQLRTIDNQPPLPNTTYTLIFDNANHAHGVAGCRPFKATYEATSDDLYFPSIEMSGEECMRPSTFSGQNMVESFGPGTRYRLRSDRLEILPVTGSALVFEPLGENAVTPPKETIWTLEAFAEGNATTPVLPNTTITLSWEGDTLQRQGSVFGSAGCNRYRAAYTSGEGLAFKPALATRMACPPDIMEQEQRFLHLLEQITTYRLGDKLRLETTGGAALVFAVQP